MIQFKIVSTVDKTQIGTYNHEEVVLRIGKVEGDMLIDDPAIGDTQLQISVHGKGGTIENLDSKCSVALNGKDLPVNSIYPFDAKDKIMMGSTNIHFLIVDDSKAAYPAAETKEELRAKFTEASTKSVILEAMEFLHRKWNEAVDVPPLPKLATEKSANPPPPPRAKAMNPQTAVAPAVPPPVNSTKGKAVTPPPLPKKKN